MQSQCPSMMAVHVLLCDDNKEFVDTLAERLQTRSFNVHVAYDGPSALKLAEERRFDAVVLDLQMPGMDGLETLERLKEFNEDLQILLLSGHATIQLGIEAMKLGAMDFMEKPVDIDLLTDKICVAQAKRLVLEEKHNEERVKEIIARTAW